MDLGGVEDRRRAVGLDVPPHALHRLQRRAAIGDVERRIARDIAAIPEQIAGRERSYTRRGADAVAGLLLGILDPLADHVAEVGFLRVIEVYWRTLRLAQH